MENEVTISDQQLGLKELIAIGVGGMIGGGIFSVMGLAAGIAGHATPLAFAVGGLIALVAGYSYIKLALAFRVDGASFTYLERAFPDHIGVATVTGWTVVFGYIGTLALYAFTFGAYGAELIGDPNHTPTRQVLSVGIMLAFMIVNLYGTRTSGKTEDLIVYIKIAILGLLALAALPGIETKNLTPVFDQGPASVFMAAALIFVAYEGFQLITNAVGETKNATRNVPRGIYGSIAIVILIYIVLSVVAIGGMPVEQLIAAEEYALAVAVEPSLGVAGRDLVSVAALLATSSAINATLFGASRMMAEMARDNAAPMAFSFRSRVDVPWIAVIVIAGLAIGLTSLGGLHLIASFSSMTFLLVSTAVSFANFRLRQKTGARPVIVVIGIVLILTTIATMIVYLWSYSRTNLFWIAAVYILVVLTVITNSAWRRIKTEN